MIAVSKCVMIVDDDENQRALYEEELTEAGYDVVPEGDARDAIASLDRRRPDLIVLDIAMPGMDGIEALGRIVSKAPDVPVLLHTAYSTYRDNFMTWAADAYVVKNSDLTKFVSTVNSLTHGPDSATGRNAIETTVAGTPRCFDPGKARETRHHEIGSFRRWPGS